MGKVVVRMAGLLAVVALLAGYAPAARAAASPRTDPPMERGFVPVLLSRVGASPAALVLGNGSCGTGRCLELYFEALGGVPVALSPPPSPAPSESQPSGDVDALVFANRLDGYAIEGSPTDPDSVVYATTDGARSWRLVSLGPDANVFTMIARSGRFFAVVVRCAGPDGRQTCDDYRLARSQAGSTTWTEVAIPGTGRLDGGPVGLTASDGTVWLTYEAQVVGAEPMLLRSTGGVGPFTIHSARQLVSVAACGLTAERRGVLWAVCPTGMMVSYLRRADAGRPFVPFWDTSGTGGALFDPIGPGLAYRYTGIGGARLRPYALQRTTDGGALFERIGLPHRFRAERLLFVSRDGGFVLGSASAARYGIAAVIETATGGRSWTTLRF